jgi:hypothetical protein
MGCSTCATGTDGQPKGCKNNGTCGSDGCNKLTVFDWLANMSLPNGVEPFNCVEVRFKNGRKEFFHNPENLTLSIGDVAKMCLISIEKLLKEISMFGRKQEIKKTK